MAHFRGNGVAEHGEGYHKTQPPRNWKRRGPPGALGWIRKHESTRVKGRRASEGGAGVGSLLAPRLWPIPFWL